jgi:acyl carrier protein
MEDFMGILSGVFQMDVNKIKDETTMEDVDRWDSLTHMKLIVSLEQAYNIEFSAEQIMAMKSIGAIKAILAEKAAA